MKNLKKLASLVLALVMVFSLATTAFAAESKLTINTTNGHTYKVYQLLVGDVSSLVEGSGTLSDTSVGENAKDKDTVTVEEIMNALKDEDGNNLSGAALGDEAYKLIDTSTNPVETVVGDGNAKGVDVDQGYYVVVDTWTKDDDGNDVEIDGETLSRYLVAVVGDTTMTPKATSVDLDKKIIDTDANEAIDDSKKTNTAAIGDTIEFEITGTVPNTEGYKYFYYVAHDTMSKGLTLTNPEGDATNDVVVKVGTDTLTQGEEYYVYTSNNAETGETTLEIAFEDMKALVDANTIAVGETITITYSAVINDQAEIGKIPNTNDVYPIYSNNPGDSERNDVDDKPGTPKPSTATGEGPNKTTKTYVTELTILKVDENGKKMPVDKDGKYAEFTLTGANLNKVIVETATSFEEAVEGETAEYYELNDGTFTKTAPTPTTYKPAGEVTELSQLFEKNADDTYTKTNDTELDANKTYYVVDVLTNADLYKSQTPTHVRITTVTTSTPATDDGTTKKIVGTVNEEGYVTFTGLNVGDYTLTETYTPVGYNTMAPIEFTISATQTDSSNVAGGAITWKSNNAQIVLDADNGVFDATIVNVPGTNLPTTGGMGTTLFYVFGSVLVLAAVVLLVTKKRVAE